MPKFQQRHYEVLAEWLGDGLRRDRQGECDALHVLEMADTLGHILELDNPHFDWGKWRGAIKIRAAMRGRDDE